jgi:hypothetical protein
MRGQVLDARKTTRVRFLPARTEVLARSKRVMALLDPRKGPRHSRGILRGVSLGWMKDLAYSAVMISVQQLKLMQEGSGKKMTVSSPWTMCLMEAGKASRKLQKP